MRRAMLLQPLIWCALSAVAQTSPQPRPLTNGSVLEMSRAGTPDATIIRSIQDGSSRFILTAESIVALHDAGVSMPVLNQMLRASRQQPSAPSFGVVTGTFPVKDAAGKTVRFSAWIKTEDVRNGYAGLWWRVDGRDADNNRSAVAFDNSMDRSIHGQPAPGNGTMRGATGTTPWTRYEFELPVDKDASSINFGVLLTGKGTAYVDAMKVELDGEPYNNPQFDFDFESPKPKGMYMGCGGSAGCTDYKVGVDDTTAYLGHQSIKLESVGGAVARIQ